MVKSLNITGTTRLYDFRLDNSKKYANLYNAITGNWYNKDKYKWFPIINIKTKKHLLKVLTDEILMGE